MSTTVAALPLGPLDPERGEFLRRVVDGLDAPALQWLSGFAAGGAHARAAAAAGAESIVPAAVAGVGSLALQGKLTGSWRSLEIGFSHSPSNP